MAFLFQITTKNAGKVADPLGEFAKAANLKKYDAVVVELPGGKYSYETVKSIEKSKEGKTEIYAIDKAAGLSTFFGKRQIPNDYAGIFKVTPDKPVTFTMDNGKTVTGTIEGHFIENGILDVFKNMVANTWFYKVNTEFGTQNVYEKDIKSISPSKR